MGDSFTYFKAKAKVRIQLEVETEVTKYRTSINTVKNWIKNGKMKSNIQVEGLAGEERHI